MNTLAKLFQGEMCVCKTRFPVRIELAESGAEADDLLRFPSSPASNQDSARGGAMPNLFKAILARISFADILIGER